MKNIRAKIIAYATAGLLLTAVIIGTCWVLSKYAVVGGHFYSKSQYVFDLRGQNVTPKTYKKLKKKLPDSWIVWDVSFQDHVYSSDLKEISLSALSDEDVDTLDFFPQLRTVHAQECRDWAQLAELQRRHPECEVIYSVDICGKSWPYDTWQISVPGLTAEEAPRLDCLLQLKDIDATGCYAYDLLEQLRQTHPQWNLEYSIVVGNKTFSREATSISATGGTYGQLRGAFQALTNLNTVMLTNPQANIDELLKLRQDFPNVQLHWQVDVFGITYPDNTTELDISGNILPTVESAKSVASYFPNLEKLIMSDCGIDNETMAAFREQMRPSYKVVWTVHFTEKCKARTDDIIFMPIKQGEYYFNSYTNTQDLKYLEDLICMDIGHAPVRDVSFLAYLPHLKYLILAHTDIRDVSPIVNCKELIFLELDSGPVPDFTPLLELTNLQDLNVGDTYADWTPLMQMTWLNNLWICCRRSAAMRTALTEALPNTHIEMDSTYTVGNGWRQLPNYYAMRDLLGMPYMN